MESKRVLLLLEIKTATRVWNRSVLSDMVPTTDELKEYYTLLCGLNIEYVTCRVENVPESFNESLLAVGMAAPTAFPAHDIETVITDVDKRTQYTKYIQQLCEMERSRAILRVFTGTETKRAAEPTASGRINPNLQKTRDWVNELLRVLNPEYDEGAIVPMAMDDTIPLGWIVTPTAAGIRDERGSRIILDSELGKRWERVLGSDLYPDLVVSRRISTANWAFQHTTSDALVKATLEWYLACQDVRIEHGISGWIARADNEMNALFATFRRIKIHERFLQAETLSNNDIQRRIFKLLSSVENQCLASALTNPEISPITTEVFRKYMNYLFRGFGITKDQFAGIEMVNQILLRWGRANLGFRSEISPLIDSWKDMWHLIMRGHATADRVFLFVRTLDCWDPIEAATVTAEDRKTIGRDWVNVFVDTELVTDDVGKIRSTYLHEKIQEWCFKYVPSGLFSVTFGPTKLGPLLTARGYVSTKRNNGRFTMGVSWKNPAMEDTATKDTATKEDATSPAKATATTATSPPKATTTSPKTQDKPAENTIHLGRI